jgi:hypothetical protein
VEVHDQNSLIATEKEESTTGLTESGVVYKKNSLMQHAKASLGRAKASLGRDASLRPQEGGPQESC